MKYLVQDCEHCLGFCCRGIVYNIGEGVIFPEHYHKIDGLIALGNNPFLPVQTFTQEDNIVEFWQCDLFMNGVCKGRADRGSFCYNMRSMLRVYPVPWCCQIKKEIENYEVWPLKRCIGFYCDPDNYNDWDHCLGFDDVYRFFQFYYHRKDQIPFIIPSEPSDTFIQEVYSTYQAHFSIAFNQVMRIRLSTSRNAFNKISLLCLKYGVTPQTFWNMFAMKYNWGKNKIPYPTFAMGPSMELYLKERLSKIRKGVEKKVLDEL